MIALLALLLAYVFCRLRRRPRWTTRSLASSLGLALLGAPAHAEPSPEDARDAELTRARAEVADQVQLAAYDLVDELVYGWTRDPVFDTPTPVVLAGVTVPVGLGTGLQSLLENHVSDVITLNPAANIQLAHCPACTAVVVRSGPEGTVVSRGIDDPEVLADLGGATGKHALFIDVEAEGTWLVLRARLTQLTPDLPIVWSHTISASASAPALLRSPEDLKSAAEARQEYLDVLQGRGPFSIPVRAVLRSYARPYQDGQQAAAPPPFLWLQSGVEMGTTEARVWTSSLLVGYSFIPQAYQGLMGQARINRLLTGPSRSLTRPDIYMFAGAAVISVWGPATAAFRDEVLTADELLADADGEGPRTAFGALHFGADLRVGNRIGMSYFLETLPALNNSQNMGEYTWILGIPFPSMGTEVTFWF